MSADAEDGAWSSCCCYWEPELVKEGATFKSSSNEYFTVPILPAIESGFARVCFKLVETNAYSHDFVVLTSKAEFKPGYRPNWLRAEEGVIEIIDSFRLSTQRTYSVEIDCETFTVRWITDKDTIVGEKKFEASDLPLTPALCSYDRGAVFELAEGSLPPK
eukprot:m.487607 g.487607  ORF g.487607 m.487607 type:complete len:161 (-) comp25153_c0_seq1:200-682(-)